MKISCTQMQIASGPTSRIFGVRKCPLSQSLICNTNSFTINSSLIMTNDHTRNILFVWVIRMSLKVHVCIDMLRQGFPKRFSAFRMSVMHFETRPIQLQPGQILYQKQNPPSVIFYNWVKHGRRYHRHEYTIVSPCPLER